MKQCPVCQVEFEPNSAKQVFCSDKCRVKNSRDKSLSIIQPPMPANPFLERMPNTPPPVLPIWAQVIDKYCKSKGITSDKLIEAYEAQTQLAAMRKPSATLTAHQNPYAPADMDDDIDFGPIDR